MYKLAKRALSAATAAATMLLVSCFSFEQDIWINKDGSGRALIDMGMSKQMLEMAKGFGDAAGEGEDPFDIAAQKKKIEADPNVTSVKVTEKDAGDMKHFIYDVEIKDMTKMGDIQKGILEDGPANGGDGPDNDFKIEKLPNGNYKIAGKIAGEEGAEAPDEAALGIMKPMFGDNAFTIRVHGPPVKHNGKLEGDTAVWSLKLIDMATGGKLDIEAEVKP